QGDQQQARLARPLCHLPGRPRRPPSAAEHPQPRPARTALVHGLALVLQRGPDLHERPARVPTAALPARAGDLDRHPRSPSDRGSHALARLGLPAAPLASPPLLYLLGRAIWIGIRGRPPTVARPLWPVWVLAAATVFLAGF